MAYTYNDEGDIRIEFTWTLYTFRNGLRLKKYISRYKQFSVTDLRNACTKYQPIVSERTDKIFYWGVFETNSS